MIPIELHNIIQNYVFDIKYKIYIYNLSKEHQNYIKIIDLYDVDNTLLKKITQEILIQPKFKYIQKLNIHNNFKVFDISHLSNTLKVLDCGGNLSNIKQNDILQLNLIELYMQNNRYIDNLNHMKNTLTTLDCSVAIRSYNCRRFLRILIKLGQDGISELHLIKLKASNNVHINNINFMKNTLKYLDCSGFSKINENGIADLKLIELVTKNNINFIY